MTIYNNGTGGTDVEAFLSCYCDCVIPVLYSTKTQVLLRKKPDGIWELLTGGIKQGEKPVGAVVRTISKKLGFEVQLNDVVYVKNYSREDGSLAKAFISSVDKILTWQNDSEEIENQKLELFSKEELIALRENNKISHGDFYISYELLSHSKELSSGIPSTDPKLLPETKLSSPFTDDTGALWKS
jgi:ADP-ribose pyrophosphatase YjhB (NUDIX family)